MSSAGVQTAPIGATRMHSTVVREVMHPGIVACPPSASLAEVARVMAGSQVHCVAVVSAGDDEPPALSGVITDVELLRWATGGSRHLPAAAFVSEPAISVSPTSTVQEAAQLMADRGVHHLVVADHRRHVPLGIISALDVARVLAGGDGAPGVAERSAS